MSAAWRRLDRQDAEDEASAAAWQAIRHFSREAAVTVSPVVGGWLLAATDVPDVEVTIATPTDKYTKQARALVIVKGGLAGTTLDVDMRADSYPRIVTDDDKIADIVASVRARLGLDA